MSTSLSHSLESRTSVKEYLSQEDCQRIRRWNDTEVLYPRNATVAELFAERRAKHPARTAVIFGSTSWTYQQLDQQATRVAQHLLKQGLGYRSVVGIMVPRSLEMVAAMLGVLKIGGTYVPLEPSYPEQRLQFMVEDASVQWLITHSTKQILADSLGAPSVNLDELLSPIAVVESITYTGPELPENPLTAEDACYIVFTSGSTGRPKGVAIPHRGIVRLVRSAPWIDYTEDDVFLQHSSQSFDLSVFEVWGPLLNGARVVVAPPHLLSLEELGQVIVENKITTLWLTSGLFHQMVNHRVQDLAGLRFLLAGGDVVSAVHARKVLTHCPGVTFVNCYGPTENTTFCTFQRIASLQDLGEGPLPIGRALPTSTHYILDSDGNEVPVGAVGEIYCGGDGLAIGYVNRPDLTNELFQWHTLADGHTERLYKSGDLGAWREDGTIDFHGRADRQVKIRGFRVELGEVEAALHDHPSVDQATVLVETEADAHKRMVAYLAVGSRTAPSCGEVRQFLSQRMPDYMIPTFFVTLPKLPLNSNGKVDYRALPKPTRESPCAGANAWGALTANQEKLIKIWEEVFHVAGLSPADEFFALGGDSMLAIVLLAKVEATFGKSLSMADLMRSPKIADFYTLLDASEKNASYSDAVLIQPGTKSPTLFYVPCLHGNLFTIRQLAKHLGSDRAIYGLQPQGVDGESAPHDTMQAIASHYLAQVRKVQPHGPYHLMGYSLGGTAAFLMAQMLQQEGETVEQLLLIDPPRRWRPWWMTRLQQFVARCGDLVRWALWQVGRRNRPTPPQLPHQKMMAAHIQAITNYKASPYWGPAVLFKHGQQAGLIKRVVDGALGLFDWRGILPESTPVVKIPGDHTTMFQGENLVVMAGEMRDLLREEEESQQ